MPEIKCLNCHNINDGSYCSRCGQRFLDNNDRSLRRILGELISSFTFADSRFFWSLGSLVTRPGRMTVDFLDGKRKRYMTPISLFLFVNIIFFFFSPISDYSLSLYEQTNLQPYHELASEMIESKLNDTGQSRSEYSMVYNRSSDNITKALIILNVPAIALFVWLIAFRKRPFYFDSLIFVFHFFTFLMLSIVFGYLVFMVLSGIPGLFPGEGLFIFIFGLLMPFVYAVIAFRKFLNQRFFVALAASVLLFAGVLAAQFIYRFFIFIVTFATT